MSVTNQNSTTPQAVGDAVSAVAVCLPPYWKRKPAVWFLQVESQFAISRIISQQRKFHYVVGAISATAAERVMDVLASFQHKPPAGPYDQLKAALFERAAASERTLIQQLLSAEELGDRRPSQLLRHMIQLCGPRPRDLDDALLRELFLQRLPSNVQLVLATTSTMDLTTLAALADKVMEVASPHSNVATINSTLPTPAAASMLQPPQSAPHADSSALDRLRDQVEQIIVAPTRRTTSLSSG